MPASRTRSRGRRRSPSSPSSSSSSSSSSPAAADTAASGSRLAALRVRYSSYRGADSRWGSAAGRRALAAHAVPESYVFLERIVAVTTFFFAASYMNALGAVVAGHRTPPQPPLPDLMHELLPIDAIHAWLGAALVRSLPDHFVSLHLACAGTVVLLDKRRWTILRRFLTVFGFVNLLRAVCVVVTALPDMSPHCMRQWDEQYPGGSGHYKTQPIFPAAFARAAKLMNDPTTTTCGDLVFSGHTSLYVLTMNIVLQYLRTDLCAPFQIWRGTLSRRSVATAKGAIRVCTLLGALSILATKFHYTLDVLIAIYVNQRAWDSYHAAALISGPHDADENEEDANGKEHKTIAYSRLERVNWLFRLVVWLEADGRDSGIHALLSAGQKEQGNKKNKKKDERKRPAANSVRSASSKTPTEGKKDDGAAQKNANNAGSRKLAFVLLMVLVAFNGYVILRQILGSSDFHSGGGGGGPVVEAADKWVRRLGALRTCVEQCIEEGE